MSKKLTPTEVRGTPEADIQAVLDMAENEMLALDGHADSEDVEDEVERLTRCRDRVEPLILAAPALLAACQAVRDHADGKNAGDYLAMIDAAIAAAEGRA